MTDFDTIRDRPVGVLLGIRVSTVAFRYVWPERAVDRLRAVLARALRNVAQLLLVPAPGTSREEGTREADRLRGGITKDLDDTLRLTELARFEGPTPPRAACCRRGWRKLRGMRRPCS